ncbi:MAG: xanthan lyase [Muribaculaceae bacterium]|nr:xanthan lyase [Muribaculaceae bacterium]
MKNRILAFSAIIALSAGCAICTHAGQRETAIENVLTQYLPGTTGFGPVKVEKVTINPSGKTVSVKCNENTSYIPLTKDQVAEIKSQIVKSLGAQYAGYKVNITAGGKTLDSLALFAGKKPTAPAERDRFFTDHSAVPAPAGLDGANIALWQSHGWYFEPKLNRWEWQRARVMQTVEDLYTQSYVMPFLMPMLSNAGAYVLSPRERDTNLTEIIIDADNSATPGFSTHNGAKDWKNVEGGFAWDGSPLINGSHPFNEGDNRQVGTIHSGSRTEPSVAVWSANIPKDDTYAVYVSYQSTPKSAADAHYTVHTATGDREFTINQNMAGGTWIYLGHFPLKAGKQDVVTLSNISSDPNAVVSADAVKIGGGMGIVERIVKEPLDDIDYQYVGSGYPKFTEGARYFLQWAGAPDSVFTPTDYVKDYNDDYLSRGLWVNWLTGGSSMLPDQEGLGLPIDLSFAFHTDAGTFLTDSIVGTLGIYCTKGDKLGNGDSRSASRDLTDLVMTNIVNDVRAQFEPRWSRRGMWDKSYAEARIPQVPSMLLELLSHQNFYDMRHGLDPAFRFTVSRAIYKGMLKFIANRDGREYIVQPLPVNTFAIAKTGDRTYTLTWVPTPDETEPTAIPTSYIIEERVGDELGFRQVATVSEPEWTVTVTDKEIHSYRIVAANGGGVSFPSETLALADLDNGSAPVLVVNGFTRISGPDWFVASEDIAGFYDRKDHGVPMIEDISFIGSQFEYRRNIPWMDDDAAGFGASRADYETQVIAGNTFDYPYIHGKSIVKAGHSFYSMSVAAYAESVADGQPRIVDLILGKQKEIQRGDGAFGTFYKSFPSELQSKITEAAAAGTSFLISGAYVASDLWDNPYSSPAVAEADQKFATEVLGYHWRVDQAAVTGEAYEVPCRFREFTGGKFTFHSELNSDCYAVESPDSFYPADSKKGCTMMRYSENNLIAGIAADMGEYRTVVIGFPLETVTSQAERDLFMGQTLKFFTAKK